MQQYSLFNYPECLLTNPISCDYLCKAEKLIFSYFFQKLPKNGNFEVSNQISQKALGRF